MGRMKMPMAPLCPPLQPALLQQLKAWLAEDLGRGDLTSPAVIHRDGRAQWIAKQEGVFCGGVLVEPLFRLLDPQVSVGLFL